MTIYDISNRHNMVMILMFTFNLKIMAYYSVIIIMGYKELLFV